MRPAGIQVFFSAEQTDNLLVREGGAEKDAVPVGDAPDGSGNFGRGGILGQVAPCTIGNGLDDIGRNLIVRQHQGGHVREGFPEDAQKGQAVGLLFQGDVHDGHVHFRVGVQPGHGFAGRGHMAGQVEVAVPLQGHPEAQGKDGRIVYQQYFNHDGGIGEL